MDDRFSEDIPRLRYARIEEPLLAAGQPEASPNRLRWVLSLFVASMLVLALVVQQIQPRATLQHVMDGPPAVVAPTGRLAVAYEESRDATVRIEARCEGVVRRQAVGIGTGFFVREDGLLMTAYHVVDPTGTVACPLEYVGVSPSGSEYDLDLLGFDAYFDLAVMQADVPAEVPFIALSQEVPDVGTGVVAIGNSRGDFLEARSGRVTRLGVQAGRADFADDTIELTAALAPGDSGGPVLNDEGEAVGVVSYISFSPDALSSDTYVPPFLRGLALPQGFASYAIPVNRTSDLVVSVLAGLRRDVPVIGFTWNGQDYDPKTSEVFLGQRAGTVVWQVRDGGPADLAGLRSFTQRRIFGDDGSQVGVMPVADVIVAVDGESTPGFYELLEVIRRKEIGQVVLLTVQRGNATFQLDLVLGAKRSVFSN